MYFMNVREGKLLVKTEAHITRTKKESFFCVGLWLLDIAQKRNNKVLINQPNLY